MREILGVQQVEHIGMAICPKCGHVSHANFKSLLEGVLTSEDEPEQWTVHHAFCICAKCGEVWYRRHTVYEYLAADDAIEVIDRTYPPDFPWQLEKEAETNVWYAVRALRDATACYNMGLYDPCVLLCRRAVELYLHEVLPGKGELNGKIEKAVAQGKITAAQKEFFHFLRMTGNAAAHSQKYVYNSDQAKDILTSSYEAVNAPYRHKRILGSIQGQ